MNPVVIWLVSGWAYIVLLVIILLALGGAVISKSGRLAGYWLGFGLLASLVLLLTGSPVSDWLNGGLTALFAVLPVLRIRRGQHDLFRTAACITSGLALVALTLELKTWWPPRFDQPPGGLVVVGDSLSAGIGGEKQTWPVELGSRMGIPVANFSKAGARVESGIKLLDGKNLHGQTVIILLGGNDMLGNEGVLDYERHLEALVNKVKVMGGLAVLVQFPAIPGRGEFPSVVVKVSSRQHVPMIHRRYLSAVLAAPESTVDDLHLSDAGHQALAEAMANILSRR